MPDDTRIREKVSSSTTCEDGDTANHNEGELGGSPALVSNHDKQHIYWEHTYNDVELYIYLRQLCMLQG